MNPTLPISHEDIPTKVIHSEAPFFVIGADRSGTTLLRLMLNEHPRLHVPRESYFLRDLALNVDPERPLTPSEVREALRIVRTHPRWPDWGITDDVLEEAMGGLGSSAPLLRDIVDRLFRLSSERDGKPRWGDKTPMYIHHIDRIHRIFPESKVLHLVRDGRDVAVSLRRIPWHGSTVLAAAAYWSRSVEQGMDRGRPLGELYREFRYEDLVLDPRGTLEAICDFLGEEFHPRMLRFHSTAAEEIAPWERTLHTKVVRPPAASDVERWRREMTPSQVLVFEAMAGRAMDALGQHRRFQGLSRAGTAVAAIPLRAAWKLVRIKRAFGLSTPKWMGRIWQAATGDATRAAKHGA